LSAAIAVKSLVNDDVEMLGVADPEEDVDVELEAEEAPELALLALLEELLLPHPAASAAAARVTIDTRNQPNLITARSSHRRAVLTLINCSCGTTGRKNMSNGIAAVHRH
jgi:hypothetical protein